MTKKNNIIINETIDGIPADNKSYQTVTPASGLRRRRTSHKKQSQKADPWIWGAYICLLLISIVELFSASSSEVRGSNVYAPLIRHCIYLGIGFVIVLFLQKTHYGYFSRFAYFFGILSFGLLILSTFFGTDINGASRAITIAGFTIQPPEIVKLTVVVVLATILGRNQQPGGVTSKAVVLVALIVIGFSGLLWINGLTNTILMMGVSVCMFLIGGIQWRKLFMVAVFYGVCGGALIVVKYAAPESTEFDQAANTEMTVSSSGVGRAETHTGRVKRFFAGVHPNDTINDYNRQVIFANMAQANGGLIGQGPGNSRENARLPLAFSDYIYSIIVEDTGFIGGVILLIIYCALLGRAGRIAYRCNRAFPAFLIMGCAVLIVLQALVHMAIVTGVFPVSGQPLPLISKGGTSIIVMSTAIGIMLSVSRFAVTTDDKKAISAELEQLPEDMQAANIANTSANS